MDFCRAVQHIVKIGTNELLDILGPLLRVKRVLLRITTGPQARTKSVLGKEKHGLPSVQHWKSSICASCISDTCCSVTQSCPTLCNPMDCSTPGLSVLHHLLKFAQVHVFWIGVAIRPSHPLMPSFPTALNLSQHQGLFQCVICSQ